MEEVVGSIPSGSTNYLVILRLKGRYEPPTAVAASFIRPGGA